MKSRPGQNKAEDYRAGEDTEEHDGVELSGEERSTAKTTAELRRTERSRADHSSRTGELYSGATAAAINSTVISKQRAAVKQMQSYRTSRQGLK